MANNGDLGGIIIAKNGVPTDPQREQIICAVAENALPNCAAELRYTFRDG